MNKLLKGSIAGAAGIALLLGGAGTLAYWNSSADLGTGSITAGNLTIAANGAATKSGPALLVPGDQVKVTQAVTVVATGENLEAALTIDEAALTGGAEFIDQVDISVQAFAGATEVTDLASLTAAEAASITSVVVTVDFEEGATVDNSAKTQSIQLGDLNVVLTQVV